MKKLILIAITIYLSANIITAQTTAADHAELAHTFWENDPRTEEDMAKVILHLGKAAELEPGNYNYVFNLGVAYYKNSSWEPAKECFIKAVTNASTGTDRNDADYWLGKCRKRIRDERIASNAAESREVSNSEESYVRFYLKGDDIHKDRPEGHTEPVLPQISSTGSPLSLINFWSNSVPGLNVIRKDAFIVTGPFSEAKLERHYNRGIKDFYNFFRIKYFKKEPAFFISVLLSENPDEIIELAERINPNIRIRSFAPFVGFFIPSDNMIVATIGGGYGTLLHEMIHALIDNEYDNFPRWLDESIASLYERCIWENGKVKPLPNWRMSFIHGPVIRLSDFDNMALNENLEGDEYAFLRLLLLYLEEKGKLEEFIGTVSESEDNSNMLDALNTLGDSINEISWQEFAANTIKDYRQELANAEGIPSFEQIKEIQAALNSILNLNLKVDGLWGANTETAVKQFQQINNMKVTGKVDNTTLTKIEDMFESAELKK